jgi:hypothetical protein
VEVVVGRKRVVVPADATLIVVGPLTARLAVYDITPLAGISWATAIPRLGDGLGPHTDAADSVDERT